MSGRGRSHNVREIWKPTCRHTLEGLSEVFKIKMDRCQRKQRHRGRCVGNFLVWDADGVAQLRMKIKEAVGT